MTIKLLKTLLIGDRSYNAGDLLDLECNGERKAALVASGHAVFSDETAHDSQPQACHVNLATEDPSIHLNRGEPTPVVVVAFPEELPRVENPTLAMDGKRYEAVPAAKGPKKDVAKSKAIDPAASV